MNKFKTIRKKAIKLFTVFVIIGITACTNVLKEGAISDKSLIPDSLNWAEKMALSQMHRNADSLAYNPATKSNWNYDKGTYLKGIEMLWHLSENEIYYNYIKKTMDSFINADGSINTYKVDEYNIDQVNPGKMVLFLYKKTGEEKYKKAAELVRSQLDTHPRTKEGGFWHKKKYPYQMWLDGLYMHASFYTDFAIQFNREKDFDDIANQFIYISKHTYDPSSGLFYHAWDESKEQKWANPQTGCAPNFWSRGIGWYAMALVDVLEIFPENHPKRADLVQILQNFASGIVPYQDSTSGVWYQLTAYKAERGNYLEASSSSMFVYALAKAYNLGLIDKTYKPFIDKGFNGLLTTFVSRDSSGIYSLNFNCRSAGLGGKPYRDGSFEYYISEPIISNDLKGVGPFIMAAVEMEKMKKTDL